MAEPVRKSRERRGRGEGGVTYDPQKELWVGTLSLGFDIHGKRNRKKVYGKTKGDVLKELGRLRAKADSGQIADAKGMTVGQLLTRWLAANRTQTGARTWEERTRVVDTHLTPKLGRIKLEKLTTLHVEGLYAELAVKPGGWVPKTAADVLGMALNYALGHKLINANPAKAIKKPRPPQSEPVVIDQEQVNALLVAAHLHPLGELVAVAMGTGCRQGELLALTWDAVDLKAKKVHIRKSLSRTEGGYVLKEPKTKAGRRSIKLPWFAVEALTARKARAEKTGTLGHPVFSTRTGNYLDRKNVRRALKAMVVRSNKETAGQRDRHPIPLKLKFHGLRHSHASLLLSAGHSLRAVSQRLGHANPALTLRIYGHCLPTDDEKLADGMGAMVPKPG
ncbi:MAG: Phage integrase family [Gemmataceae bacterium]|nr:Phage integrase family [Gemmataceae bacterium]